MTTFCSKSYTLTLAAGGSSPFAYFKCDEASPINQLNNSIDAFHLPLSVGIPGVSVAGKISTALEMGIANRSFVAAADAHWLINHSFTVRFWYKPTLGNPGSLAIFWNNDQTFTIFRWESSPFMMEMSCRTVAGTEWVDSSALTVGDWNRVICWFEEGVGLGIKINNDAAVTFATASPLAPLGSSYPYLSMSHFVGNDAIDEIGIWNQKLSDADMLFDWNGGAGRTYP